MPLVDLDFADVSGVLPADVKSFLREANRRVARFQLRNHVPAFVPSDYGASFCILKQLADAWALPGRLFCEWGSGLGVVACLAAMLDFDSCGIEIEADLVDAAQQLADDFVLPVKFIQGSFIPRGGEAYIANDLEFDWLAPKSDHAHDELGMETDDFAIIFAYPWPDEEKATADLFERFAGIGAVLVTYHDSRTFRVRRKTG
jgi:hypothetical protein